MKSKLKYIGIGAFVGIVLVLGVAATATDFRMGRTMEILVNMVREISDSYVDVTDADKLLRDAADGMTSGLDAYTYFLDEKDLEGFEVLTTGRYAGIGSGIRQRGDTTIFAEPYKGFPADRAGIRIGDAIVEIDGKSAIGIGTDKVSEMLRGDVGSVANITFKCLADGTIRKVDIRREMIVRSGVVYSAMLNDTTGYINHADFTDNVSADFRAALEAIIASGATRVIIDERSNGGGILQEAVKILSLFLPVGTEVVEMRGRIESESRTFYTELEPIGEHLDLVVLINEGTASSSEIVAGALQDHHRATLMGAPSFGKGSVQTVIKVDNEHMLKLTTAHYFTPSGRSIQAKGIEPDILVDDGRDILRVREANLQRHLETPANGDVKKEALPEETSSSSSQTQEKTPAMPDEPKTEKLRVKPVRFEFGGEKDFQLQQALNQLKGLPVLLARENTENEGEK